MSFSPFVEVSRGAVTDISSNSMAGMDHSSPHRHHPLGNGLKKWLSLRRLNSAYRHANNKNPKVLTRKRNHGHSSMPPHQRQSAQPNDTKFQAEDVNKKLLLPLLSAPSNVNPQEARIGEVEKERPLPEGPPTTATSSENEDESKPDQPPPRRKRSLMYAVYCTAKEDEDGEEQENGTSMADDIMKESLARIQPWLDSLNNPMALISDNDHLSNIQEEEEEEEEEIGVSESSLADSNQTVPSLTSINAYQQQLHQNVLGIKGICDTDSIISSDSDESSIESPAFQCKTRYAPRLSTVERSQDGRILIKPSTSTSNSSRVEEQETEVSPVLGNPDSGNASIAGDSPRVLGSNIAVAHIADSICNPTLSKVSIEEFPPIPQAYTRRRRGREHSDSLLIHASHLGNSSSSISKDKKNENTAVVEVSSLTPDFSRSIKMNPLVRSQPNLHVPEMIIDNESSPSATSLKLGMEETTATTATTANSIHSDDEDYIEKRSRLFSILSDISDIELPELDLPHTPPANSSFLLDGVLPPSVSALTAAENDKDDDDLSLAEMMAISSPSPPQQPDKPVVANKKLAWVLSRARSNNAKLEGIRNLRRKKKENQVASQQGKTFRFNEMVAVYETWAGDEYDRRGAPTIRLDAKLIDQIKQELNEYKVYEMRVHEKSRCNTHFIY